MDGDTKEHKEIIQSYFSEFLRPLTKKEISSPSRKLIREMYQYFFTYFNYGQLADHGSENEILALLSAIGYPYKIPKNSLVHPNFSTALLHNYSALHFLCISAIQTQNAPDSVLVDGDVYFQLERKYGSDDISSATVFEMIETNPELYAEAVSENEELAEIQNEVAQLKEKLSILNIQKEQIDAKLVEKDLDDDKIEKLFTEIETLTKKYQKGRVLLEENLNSQDELMVEKSNLNAQIADFCDRLPHRLKKTLGSDFDFNLMEFSTLNEILKKINTMNENLVNNQLPEVLRKTHMLKQTLAQSKNQNIIHKDMLSRLNKQLEEKEDNLTVVNQEIARLTELLDTLNSKLVGESKKTASLKRELKSVVEEKNQLKQVVKERQSSLQNLQSSFGIACKDLSEKYKELNKKLIDKYNLPMDP